MLTNSVYSPPLLSSKKKTATKGTWDTFGTCNGKYPKNIQAVSITVTEILSVSRYDTNLFLF